MALSKEGCHGSSVFLCLCLGSSWRWRYQKKLLLGVLLQFLNICQSGRMMKTWTEVGIFFDPCWKKAPSGQQTLALLRVSESGLAQLRWQQLADPLIQSWHLLDPLKVSGTSDGTTVGAGVNIGGTWQPEPRQASESTTELQQHCEEGVPVGNKLLQ